MRGLADSWTSKQVGGWGPNSRLGSKMLPREGRANFEIPMCAESSLLWSYSRFFSYLQRFPEALSIGVRASLALPKRLGLLDTQARGTALPRWPRRHSQLARHFSAANCHPREPEPALGDAHRHLGSCSRYRREQWDQGSQFSRPCPWPQTLLHPVHRGFSRLE